MQRSPPLIRLFLPTQGSLLYKKTLNLKSKEDLDQEVALPHDVKQFNLLHDESGDKISHLAREYLSFTDRSRNGVLKGIPVALDFLLAALCLALSALPMLVIALIIRLESPGPALFRQVRSRPSQ